MIRLANSQLALCCAECGHRWEIGLDALIEGETGPECPDCGGWVWAGDYAVPLPTADPCADRWAS